MSMNKLRKPHPSTSRPQLALRNDSTSSSSGSMTMKYATSAVAPGTSSQTSTWVASPRVTCDGASLPDTPKRNIDEVVPLNVTEQYWAARALKAEALLAAQESHKHEFRTLGDEQDMKRQREMAHLASEYKEKHASLERLLTFLLLLIAFMVIFIIYLATHYTRHSMLLHQKQNTSWWSAIGASHFTIPILSPFTSVVENESSIIGTKTIATFTAIGAVLLYFIFRYWISRPGKRLIVANTKASSAFSPVRGATLELTNYLSRTIDQ